MPVELKKVRCPHCRELCDWKDNPNKPFCSEHCKTQDLGAWAMEKYRIPGNEIEEAEGQPTPRVHTDKAGTDEDD